MEKKEKSKRLYGNSPTVERGEDGKMSVHKPGVEDAEATASGNPETHDAERKSMHKRHEEEQTAMHDRHESDMKEMHKRHEKASKEPKNKGDEEVAKTEEAK